MNTLQIDNALRSNPVTSPSFRGVFAADRLPILDHSIPSCYVANCSNADTKGSHWVAFYQDQPAVIEIFDSYEKPLNFHSAHLAAFTRGLKEVWQVQTLQQPMSTVCGHYCLYFLYNRCCGQSYEQLIQSFTKNAFINDKVVCQYVNRCFNMTTKVFDLNMLDQCVKSLIKNLHQ